MQTIQFHPSAGSMFDSYCEFAFILKEKINKYFKDQNVLSLTEKEIDSLHEFVPNRTNIWSKEVYNNTSREQRNDIQQSEVYLFLKTLEKDINYTYSFNFNGREIQVTTVEDMKLQWEKIAEKKEEDYQKWLLSDEGIKEQKKQKKAEEKQKRLVKERKSLLASEQMTVYNHLLYKTFEENNSQDPYGLGVLHFAKAWAIYMEKDIIANNNILTKEIMESCCTKADTEGITGFMYGCAVGFLSKCWIYGEQLRQIHNGEYNIDSLVEGVVNPAVLVINA